MSLDSMKEIFEHMEQEGKPFWEIVLEADMDDRQVSRNQSMAKMLLTWQAMADAARQLHRTAAQRQRSGRRRRHEDAAVLLPRRGHVRRLRQRGHRRGAVHGGVQRLHVPHRSGSHGGSLRRAAGSAAAPVQVRGAQPAPATGGAVCGQRHRGGHRLPGLHRRRVRRLSGGDRHGVRHGGGCAGGPAGRHRPADRPRCGHGAEEPDGADLRSLWRAWWRCPA